MPVRADEASELELMRAKLAALEARALEEEAAAAATLALHARLQASLPVRPEDVERRARLRAWDCVAFLRRRPSAPPLPKPPLRHVVVELVLDYLCPWCYIAYRRLEKALGGLAPEARALVQVVTRPYFLQPDTPHEAQREVGFHTLHAFGPAQAAGFGRSGTLLQKAAEEVGVFLHPNRIVGNTAQAHRLAVFAAARGKGPALAEAVFRVHMEGGRDISRHDVLIACGAVAGLHRKEVERYLHEGEGLQALYQQEREMKVDVGLAGVPAFFFWWPPEAGEEGLPQPLLLQGSMDQTGIESVLRDLLHEVQEVSKRDRGLRRPPSPVQRRGEGARERPRFLLRNVES